MGSISPQMCGLGNGTNFLISGKTKVVKYYSIWPEWEKKALIMRSEAKTIRRVG